MCGVGVVWLCEVPRGAELRASERLRADECIQRFVGMLDVDRVVMILPQVHLRNGEFAETKLHVVIQAARSL